MPRRAWLLRQSAGLPIYMLVCLHKPPPPLSRVPTALPPPTLTPKQNTDCAAAVMLMTREDAERRGLPIMAALRSFAAAAVPPAIMGKRGPVIWRCDAKNRLRGGEDA